MKAGLEESIRALMLVAAIAGGASVMSACESDGPLEEAGESVDEAIDEIDEEL